MHSDEACKYVTKEDTRIDGPFEFGEKPVIGVKYNTK